MEMTSQKQKKPVEEFAHGTLLITSALSHRSPEMDGRLKIKTNATNRATNAMPGASNFLPQSNGKAEPSNRNYYSDKHKHIPGMFNTIFVL